MMTGRLSLPPVDNVYRSSRQRQHCSRSVSQSVSLIDDLIALLNLRMSPADKRYWQEVAGENLRLYRLIQSNSGARPHHHTTQSHLSLPTIHPTPRSSRPSERQYWSDVSKENKRLLK